MSENDLEILKTDFPDAWNYLSTKLAYPYKNFTIINGYQNPVNYFQKEDFVTKLKNA